MKVTSIRLKRINNEWDKEKYKVHNIGLADICFDKCFVVHGISIMENLEGGRYITMPVRHRANTPYSELKDVAHPITTEFRNYLNDLVIDAFSTNMIENIEKIEIIY